MPAFEAGAAQPVSVDTTGGKRAAGAAIPVYVAAGGPQMAGPARRVVVVTSGPVEERAAVPVYEVASGGALIDGPAQPVYVVAGSLGALPIALLASLVSYWKLDEASGTRVDSVVASGNDLADNNTVTQNPGKIDNAAQFTAANSESLSRASNASLRAGDIDLTIAAWVYLDSKSARRPIVAKFNAAGQREYLLEYFNASDRFRFVVSNDGTASAALMALAAGAPATAAWYFVVGWHDSAANTLNIQVNDGAVESLAHATGVFSGTEIFRIGSGAGFFMDGRIDEVGFWKKVLNSAERTALYNGGAGRTYPFAGI